MEQNAKSMSREILFRGKRVDNGGWVYGFYLANINPHKEYNSFDNHFIYEGVNIKDAIEVHPSTVGQFTGLHDKDGNKIFEGDIVGGYPHGTVSVAYNNEWGCYESRNINAQLDDVNGLFANDLKDCFSEWFIMGNIQDNPELLK